MTAVPNVQSLTTLLEALEQSVANFANLGNKRSRLQSRFRQLRLQYEAIEIPEQMQEVFAALVAKGENLVAHHFRISISGAQLNESLCEYIRYLEAAYGDFTGQTAKITYFYRIFLICSILIMLLSPFVISPIFSLLLLIPILMGARGLRERTRLGYTLSLTVGAGGLITSAFWLKYAVFLLQDYNTMLENFMQVNSFLPQTVAQILIVLLPILGLLLFALTLWFIYKAWTVRKLFV